jgi:hypothetical protein
MRARDEPTHDLDPKHRAEIGRDAPFVAVENLMIEPDAVLQITPAADAVAPKGMLDLDDVGTVVRELHADEGA